MAALGPASALLQVAAAQAELAALLEEPLPLQLLPLERDRYEAQAWSLERRHGYGPAMPKRKTSEICAGPFAMRP